MKVTQIRVLFSKGPLASSKELKSILKQIEQAIKSVEWPPNSGSFILHDQPGKKRNQGSGVKPIKEACMLFLKSNGWKLEVPVNVASRIRPGPMDAAISIKDKLFCFEWETGNISSSHRALNKMAVGILKGILAGGVLILPSRKMYKYLTDRIGNFCEIEPYFHLWESLNAKEGFLAVIEIEHDGVSKDVPRIPKGTDGRSLL